MSPLVGLLIRWELWVRSYWVREAGMGDNRLQRGLSLGAKSTHCIAAKGGEAGARQSCQKGYFGEW
jgi:hypothetical protein